MTISEKSRRLLQVEIKQGIKEKKPKASAPSPFRSYYDFQGIISGEVNETADDDEKLIVAKLGGSLIDLLPDVLQALKESDKRILIVPGGGIFADSVRDLDPDTDSAHWMAILGMEQYGHYISSFGIYATDSLNMDDCPGRVAVLLPYKFLRENDTLPHSWDVTSDSIAAYIAYTLSAGLIILKSVDGLTKDEQVLSEVCADSSFEEVDPFLIPYLIDKNIDTWILNARKTDILRNFFSGGEFFGTHIHGKFLSANTPNL